MTVDRIFSSTTNRIPEVRRDIQVIPVQHNGSHLLYFHDTMEYTPPNFALDASAEPLLSLLNGRHSIHDIVTIANGSVSESELLEFIRMLDENRILNSSHYHKSAEEFEVEFEKKNVRPSILQIDDPGLLEVPVNNDIHESAPVTYNSAISALYAPHIDLRIGKSIYQHSFSLLRKLKPKRVIILGTSHYAGFYNDYYSNIPFIGTEKSFQVNGRTLHTDTESVQSLLDGSPKNGFTIKDRAHRIEHSIEIHLLYASEIWNHSFSIVPILVSGFDELFYMRNGHLAKQLDSFTSGLEQIIDDETFVLVSGDLSHVGKKFGDPKSAAARRSDVEQFDRQFMEIASQGSDSDLLHHIAQRNDDTNVCGFSPLYTYLRLNQEKTGTQLNYHWWDESERESAVSFGSILYGKS